MTNPRLAWAMAAAWFALILTASSIPGDAVSLPPLWSIDKLLHAAQYLLLALLTLRAGRLSWRPWPGWQRAALLGAGLLLVAAADEWHQLLVPGRDANSLDMLADWAGVLFGVTIGAAIAHQESSYAVRD